MKMTSWPGALRRLAWGLGILALLCVSACGGGDGGFFVPGASSPPAGLHYERNAVVYSLGRQIDANAPSNSGGQIGRASCRERV